MESTKIKVVHCDPSIDWRIDGSAEDCKDLALTSYQYARYFILKIDGILINSYYSEQDVMSEAYRARNLSEMVGVPAEIEVVNLGKKRE